MTVDIKHLCLPVTLAIAAMASVASLVPLKAQAPKPKHVNRAIELLEACQPI
jgi:hypothetical protein